MEIKYENLKRMYNHVLLNVKEEEFDLGMFTDKEDSFKERPVIDKDYFCGSIGCIIGHCAVLDLDNINKNFISEETIFPLGDIYGISFFSWSHEFVGIPIFDSLWNFLFGNYWIDILLSKKHALARMKMLIDTEDPIRCSEINEEFFQEYPTIRTDSPLLSDMEIVKIISYSIPEEFFKEEVYEIL